MVIKIAPAAVPETIAAIGPHKDSHPIFAAKCVILPLKVTAVRMPAINIIKQEMLAAGGDAVTPAGAVVCSGERGDLLLLGTARQYSRLAEKLALMKFFGLPDIAREVADAVAADGRPPTATILADGRVIGYERTRVMGIINVNDDSFYAASRVVGAAAVTERAAELLAAGADILDVGAESTRPGAAAIDGDEERRRLIPALAAVREKFPAAVLSVDTYRSDTARAAIAAGADIINDVADIADDTAMQELVAATKTPLVIMHNPGKIGETAEVHDYRDPVGEVAAYFAARAKLLAARGVGADKIILDPGIGFGKDAAIDLTLLKNLASFTGWGYPVLLAASRKRVIGAALDRPSAAERLFGTVALSCQAVSAGAGIVRVHDVAANRDAIRMTEAVNG